MAINERTALRAGVRDWIIQRTTAVIMLLYVVVLAVFILKNMPVDFLSWKTLYSYSWMKVFSIIFIVSACYHGWVGIWTILTDYVNCFYLRSLLIVLFFLALVSYVIWTIQILWGV